MKKINFWKKVIEFTLKILTKQAKFKGMWPLWSTSKTILYSLVLIIDNKYFYHTSPHIQLPKWRKKISFHNCLNHCNINFSIWTEMYRLEVKCAFSKAGCRSREGGGPLNFLGIIKDIFLIYNRFAILC